MKHEKILGTCTDFRRTPLFDGIYTVSDESTGNLTLFADRSPGQHIVHVTDNEITLLIACGYTERSERTYEIIETYQNDRRLADASIFIKRIMGRDALFLSVRLFALPDDEAGRRELELFYSDYIDAYHHYDGFLKAAAELIGEIVPKERYESAGQINFDRNRLVHDLYQNVLLPLHDKNKKEIFAKARKAQAGEETTSAAPTKAAASGNRPSVTQTPPSPVKSTAKQSPAPIKSTASPKSIAPPYDESEEFLEEMADFRYTVNEGIVTLTSLKRKYTQRLTHGPFADMGEKAPVCLSIPAGVHKLHPRSLSGEKAEAVDWLYLLYDVTVIGTAACAGLKQLTKLELRSPLTVVGERAFAETGLETVRLPDSTQRILKGAFADCKKLRLAYVPAACKVAADAFPPHTEVVRDAAIYKAKEAAPVVSQRPVEKKRPEKPIPPPAAPTTPNGSPQPTATPTAIPVPQAPTVDVRSRRFEQMMQSFRYRIEAADRVVVQGCRNAYTHTEIPEGVTEIAGNAFAYTDTKSVERITLPSTLRVLQANAFKGNFPALREIVFAESGVMEALTDAAFGALNAKHSITVKLPPSVKQIDDGAFRDFRCTMGLLELHVSADCRISDGALPDYTTVKKY